MIGSYTISSNKSGAEEKMDLDKSMAKEESIRKDDKMMKDKTAKPETSQRYIQYSQTNLDSPAKTRRVLFFYANWCPTCRPTDQDLNTNSSKIPEDVTIIRVNYNDTETNDEEKALAKKYGVTYQHTFVQIDENGNEVAKWNGGKLNELLKNIKS